MTAPAMSARRLGTVLVLLSLPVVLAAIDAVAFQVANRSNGRFVSSGKEREYLLHVPPSYDRAKPTALVISLHGAGLWGAAQQEISQWNRVADRAAFLVVYPSGDRRSGLRVWHVDDDVTLPPDVLFIAVLHPVRSDRRRRDGGNRAHPALGMV
jgi:poly(3-hydroxybutyrate) depolymerase